MKEIVFVSKDPSMFDAEIKILIKNLKPAVKYTLHSVTNIGKDCFQSFALYVSSDRGIIDLSSHLSYGGSFKGVEPMGLFWSVKSLPEQGKKEFKRFIKRDATPVVFEITLFQGWFSSMQDATKLSNKKITSFQLTRMFMAHGVKRIEVDKDGLKGVLFLPAGNGPFPGVINMYGGIPGSPEFKPALLASHGFAALALPYYGIEGLPSTWAQLEMEYFEKAVKFLRNHASVDGAKGVGVIGVCKGGQIALAMADCLDGIKCVIASNCALNAIHNNHSYRKRIWNGLGFPMITSDILQNKNGAISSRAMFDININSPKFQSNLFRFYERPNIAFMYIAGLEDYNVPSEFFCNLAEKLLKNVKHPNFTVLRYPGTGHIIEPPYNPVTPEVYFRDFLFYVWNGGKPVPHCRAQIDAWSKQIQFLHQNLRTSKVNAKL